MKITSPHDLRIGHWATLCCHLDLFQVLTEEKLQEIRLDWAEDGIPWEAWETEPEALAAIALTWPEGSEERSECERRAKVGC